MLSREEQHQLQCEDRRKVGLLYVVVALQPDNCLGDASNNSRPTTRHQVDPLLNIRRPRLCLRPGLALAHTPAYVRENIPAMHLCTASRSERWRCWTSPTQQQWKWTEKIFHQLKGSLLSEAQSDTTAEQAATSGIASVRTGTPSECWIECGSHPSTAHRPR